MQPRIVTLACLASLLLWASAGCVDPPADSPQRAAQPLTRSSHSTSAPEPVSAAAAEEAAVKASGVQRPQVATPIDWQAAQAQPERAAPSSPEVQRALEALALPLLLPADPAAWEVALITHGARWAAASMTWDGHNVYVMGSAQAFEDPRLVEAHGEAQEALRLTRTHGIVTAAFERFGVAYTLNVECDAPMDDARCTEDDYARALVTSLVVAGGAP